MSNKKYVTFGEIMLRLRSAEHERLSSRAHSMKLHSVAEKPMWQSPFPSSGKRLSL